MTYNRSSMNKNKIVEILKDRILVQIQEAEAAYKETAQFASHDDTKSEGKYDTRGIEAGILAGAQKKRVEELKIDLELLESIPIYDFRDEDEIALGALVEIEINSMKKKYFISSTSGGSLLQINGEPILVISVFSPMGSAIINLKRNDTFEIESPSGTRSHKILNLW